MDWIYKGKKFLEAPKEIYGFTYKITITDPKSEWCNHYYIGKKAFYHLKKTKIGKRTIKQTGTRKRVEIKQSNSNWKTYIGSSKELKEVLKGCSKYKKEILDFYPNKASLSLGEAKAILCENAIKDPKCFNKWYSCKIFKNQLNER